MQGSTSARISLRTCAGGASGFASTGQEADFEAAVGRVRAEAERIEATQFELVTAAALVEFASAEVEVAVVEAGLGGRYDATNVLRSPVQVLTNVALEHTEVLGTTREAIAVEKLAVVQPGAIVIVGEPEWEGLAARERRRTGRRRRPQQPGDRDRRRGGVPRPARRRARAGPAAGTVGASQ